MTPPTKDGGVTVRRGVVFSTIPGFRGLELDLYVPEAGARALCVYVHGGGWRMGSRRDGPGPLSPMSGQLFVRAARRGLAIASVDYRLSSEATFPAALDDVTAAAAYLDDHRADLGLGDLPLVAWGVSAGGLLAAMHALTGTPAVAALACWYAVTDIGALPDDVADTGAEVDRSATSREALFLGAAVAEVPDRAAAASPARRVTAGAPPTLLAQGDADVAVPHRQAERLQAALTAAGTPVELITVSGMPHMFVGIEPARLEALVDGTVDFLLAAAAG